MTMAFVSLGTFAQKVVKGVVKDDAGEPLIGVTVSAGDNKGGVTDIDGRFMLSNVSSNTILNFSYLGYNNTLLILM